MKQKTLYILIATLVLTFGTTLPAYAVMRAVFPDNTTFQPMPEGATANISNNVQNKGTVAPEIEIQKDTPATNAVAIETEARKESSYVVWWILLGVAILAGAGRAIFKKKKVV